MNRSRQHTKAAKARKEWQGLQEQKLKEEEEILIKSLEKELESKKPNPLSKVS